MALTQALILIIAVAAVASWLNLESCQQTAGCARTVIGWVLGISIPVVVLVAWLWGSWYANKTLVITNQLERDYNRQVGLVEFQRQRNQIVMQHLADGVLLLNKKGEIRLINRAAADMLDIPQAKAIGQLFSSVAWNHELIDLWQACRLDQSEQRGTLELDRQGRFLEAIFTPIQPQEGVSYLVVLQDLTRIRRLESIRRDFIGNVSHELLTPIASVKAVVETLEDGALDNREIALKFLGRAADEVDSMTQLVNELLTLTRIESGVTEFKFSPTAVSELLLRPVERFAEQAGRKEIELSVDVPLEMPLVLADCEQVWQVIRNFLHNAIKHTPRSGKVSVSASQMGDEVVLAIKDTGVGIYPDDLPRIFERFYKADRSRNRGAVSGTGLGLSIAKHIVLAHNGRVWAESDLGKGSTFFLALPIVDE